MDGPMVASDENLRQVPNLDLAQRIFRLEKAMKCSEDTTVLLDSIMKDIKEDNMLPLYLHLCEKFGLDINNSLSSDMKSFNETALAELDNKKEEATKNAGDTEILDAVFSKARYFAKIGGWSDSLAVYDEILKLEKVSTGKKIDATLDKARVALFIQDVKQLRDLISQAKKMIESGGDWDRRNRLKVYEAIYFLAVRDIKSASVLFLECIATFTCVELCSYKQFMFYAILTGILSVNRTDLKSKIIANPQVISVIRDLPQLGHLLTSLYNCEYAAFVRALLAISPDIAEDRYSGPHFTFIIREFRILAYSQFLEAYRSVMLSSMATSFGMSVELLDAELSRFIAAGRLSAKIDKVGDVIETSRPDKKNSQYQEVIKKGDTLLNQIQKLVRAVDV